MPVCTIGKSCRRPLFPESRRPREALRGGTARDAVGVRKSDSQDPEVTVGVRGQTTLARHGSVLAGCEQVPVVSEGS